MQCETTSCLWEIRLSEPRAPSLLAKSDLIKVFPVDFERNELLWGQEVGRPDVIQRIESETVTFLIYTPPVHAGYCASFPAKTVIRITERLILQGLAISRGIVIYNQRNEAPPPSPNSFRLPCQAIDKIFSKLARRISACFGLFRRFCRLLSS